MIWARSERIAHEAAAWTVWLDGDDLKPRDIARFRRWLAKSEQHRQAFQHANRVWTDLDQLERLKSHPEIAALLASVDEPAPETSAHGVNPGALDRRALLMGAGAGALALGLGGYDLLEPKRAEA